MKPDQVQPRPRYRYNIAAIEVEDVLLRHEAVAECAVIGARDEERGQIVKAFVVLRPRTAATRRW